MTRILSIFDLSGGTPAVAPPSDTVVEVLETAGSDAADEVTAPLAGEAKKPGDADAAILEDGNLIPGYKISPPPLTQVFSNVGTEDNGALRMENQGILGGGEIGSIHQVTLPRHRHPVALKIIDPTKVSGIGPERLHAVKLALPRGDNTGVVHIHQVGKVGERPAFTMELVDGVDLETLSRHLQEPNRRRALPVRVALLLAEKISDTLEGLHRHGIIAVDFSLRNVLLTRSGEVTLGDPDGFALIQELILPDFTAAITPAMAAPEYLARVQPNTAGPDTQEAVFLPRYADRLDVFSLGIALGRLISGKAIRPDKGHLWRVSPENHGHFVDAIMATVEKKLTDDGSLARVRSEILGLMRRMLAFDPSERATAESVAGTLSAILSSLQADSLREFAAQEVQPRGPQTAQPQEFYFVEYRPPFDEGEGTVLLSPVQRAKFMERWAPGQGSHVRSQPPAGGGFPASDPLVSQELETIVSPAAEQGSGLILASVALAAAAVGALVAGGLAFLAPRKEAVDVSFPADSATEIPLSSTARANSAAMSLDRFPTAFQMVGSAAGDVAAIEIDGTTVETLPDKRGLLVLHLPEGRHTLAFTLRDGTRLETPITVNAPWQGQENAAIRPISLDPASTAQRDTDRRAPAAAAAARYSNPILIRPIPAGSVFEIRAGQSVILADGSGRYTLPPGRYTFYAFHSDYQPLKRTLTVGPDGQVDIRVSSTLGWGEDDRPQITLDVELKPLEDAKR